MISRSRSFQFRSPGLRWRPSLAAIAAAWAVGGLTGCGTSDQSTDPQAIAALRAEIVLSEEPPGAATVLDVRGMFTGPVDDLHHDHEDRAADASLSGSEDVELATDDVVEIDVEVHDPADSAHVAEDPAGQTAHSSASPASGPQEVVIVGMIGGMPNPWKETEPQFPFKNGQATIFLVDPATVAEFDDHGHAEGEDHHDCPFCARRAAQNVNSVAVANIVDEQGAVVPIDARELLELTEQDMVVLQGTAEFLGGNLLVINAKRIYVRR